MRQLVVDGGCAWEPHTPCAPCGVRATSSSRACVSEARTGHEDWDFGLDVRHLGCADWPAAAGSCHVCCGRGCRRAHAWPCPTCACQLHVHLVKFVYLIGLWARGRTMHGGMQTYPWSHADMPCACHVPCRVPRAWAHCFGAAGVSQALRATCAGGVRLFARDGLHVQLMWFGPPPWCTHAAAGPGQALCASCAGGV